MLKHLNHHKYNISVKLKKSINQVPNNNTRHYQHEIFMLKSILILEYEKHKIFTLLVDQNALKI